MQWRLLLLTPIHLDHSDHTTKTKLKPFLWTTIKQEINAGGSPIELSFLYVLSPYPSLHPAIPDLRTAFEP